MTLSPKALIEATGAEFVAGEAIAIVDSKHVSLAKNTADGLVLTAEGLALANSLRPLDRDAEGSDGGSRRGQRRKRADTATAANPAAAEPEPETIEQDAEGSDEHRELEFHEDLDLEDHAG